MISVVEENEPSDWLNFSRVVGFEVTRKGEEMKEIKCKECKHGWPAIKGMRFCMMKHDLTEEKSTCENAEKKEEE